MDLHVVRIHTNTIKKYSILQGQFIVDSDNKQSEFMKLKCGCMINDLSGELYQECISHLQANFMK